MSAALDERSTDVPLVAPVATRVAIREVREMAFRSLVAAGASNAEARVAAEQVVFTELHRGAGLSALLEELSFGSWGRSGLAHTRDVSSVQLVLRVSGSGRAGPLRQGALLLDLLVAESEKGAAVVSDGLDSLSPLLDEPLIRAATAAECWIIAVRRTHESINFRVASADGAIGVGEAEGTRLWPDEVGVPMGVSLVRRELLPEGNISWLAAAEQRATRCSAAQNGLLIDAGVWAQVKTAAAAYLVPEQ